MIKRVKLKFYFKLVNKFYAKFVADYIPFCVENSRKKRIFEHMYGFFLFFLYANGSVNIHIFLYILMR